MIVFTMNVVMAPNYEKLPNNVCLFSFPVMVVSFLRKTCIPRVFSSPKIPKTHFSTFLLWYISIQTVLVLSAEVLRYSSLRFLPNSKTMGPRGQKLQQHL